MGDVNWCVVATSNNSIVYKGTFPAARGLPFTEFAKKVPLYKEYDRAYEKEMAVMTSMNHPNVLRPLAVTGDEKAAPAILMEYFPYGSVLDWMRYAPHLI